MCVDPVSAGLTIGSAVLSYAGQQQAAKAQASAAAQGRSLAIQNQALQIRALNNQEEEDRISATDAILKGQREAAQVSATARVAAGEAGISGLSVDALLGDITLQEAENNNTILETQDFRQRQRQLDREGIGITTQSQINQLPTPQYPNFLGTLLSGSGSLYGTYKQDKYYDAITK